MKAMELHSVENQRIAVIDVARGLALMAMTAFHFTWDLANFRVIDPQIMFQPFAVWSARSIAATFLFLAGAGLFLAHEKSINWRGFGWRFAQVGGAALLISAATWFATPDAFIFFGILHQIAFASLAGLAFLRLPWWAVLASGLLVLFSRTHLQTALLDAPWWWWSGLSQVIPVSNDYVPVFPFSAMVLLGIAAAKIGRITGVLANIAQFDSDNGATRFLQFLGRHSLVYYLLHQPVIIAVLYGFLWLSGRI